MHLNVSSWQLQQHQCKSFSLCSSVTHGDPEVSQIYKAKALSLWAFSALPCCPDIPPSGPSYLRYAPGVFSSQSSQISLSEAHLGCKVISPTIFIFPKALNFDLLPNRGLKDLEDGHGYMMSKGLDSISGTLLLILVLLLFKPTKSLRQSGPQFPHP